MDHYGIPTKITNIIKNSYNGTSCKVMHAGQLSQSFEVKTGVKQGCLCSEAPEVDSNPGLRLASTTHNELC